MNFKVGDKVRAEVGGQVLVGVVKETETGSRCDSYLVYFDGWNRGHNGNDVCREKYEGDHCWYFLGQDLELIERGEKDMKKSDLRNGAIVEIRKGDKHVLLLNTKNSYCKNCLVSLDDGGYLSFDDYNDDLKDCDDSEYDIVKICQHEYVGDNIRCHILKQNENDWTWIRVEETVMTISEIEEKLGISNLKIKKED